jgi:hypothetical protein
MKGKQKTYKEERDSKRNTKNQPSNPSASPSTKKQSPKNKTHKLEKLVKEKTRTISAVFSTDSALAQVVELGFRYLDLSGVGGGGGHFWCGEVNCGCEEVG